MFLIPCLIDEENKLFSLLGDSVTELTKTERKTRFLALVYARERHRNGGFFKKDLWFGDIRIKNRKDKKKNMFSCIFHFKNYLEIDLFYFTSQFLFFQLNIVLSYIYIYIYHLYLEILTKHNRIVSLIFPFIFLL